MGSEGTLGFITRVTLLTPPRPRATNVALIGCRDYASVMEAYRLARQDLGEVLSGSAATGAGTGAGGARSVC